VRKLIAFLLAAILIGSVSISLTGCGGGNKSSPKASPSKTEKPAG
jgi:hypothetical protein